MGKKNAIKTPWRSRTTHDEHAHEDVGAEREGLHPCMERRGILRLPQPSNRSAVAQQGPIIIIQPLPTLVLAARGGVTHHYNSSAPYSSTSRARRLHEPT